MDIFCFYGHSGENAYLSNWFHCDFTVGDLKFTSMEQFMMYKKAVIFGDFDIANKILAT